MGGMSDDKFSISVSGREHRAQLVVGCLWLGSADYLDFRSECYRLLETEQPNLRIDLGKLDSISSMFLGILVARLLGKYRADPTPVDIDGE